MLYAVSAHRELRKERLTLTQTRDWWNRRERWEHDGLISAVAFGGFLIILGMVFFITPDFIDKVSAFFRDITGQMLPFSSLSTIVLPAPQNPAAHLDLYRAVLQFDIGLAILQVVILALRLGLQSRTHRIAETVSNLVFWAGAAVLVNVFLLTGTLQGYFEYWAALIIVFGVSMVARAVVHFARRK
jgi:hypothetical protein